MQGNIRKVQVAFGMATTQRGILSNQVKDLLERNDIVGPEMEDAVDEIFGHLEVPGASRKTAGGSNVSISSKSSSLRRLNSTTFRPRWRGEGGTEVTFPTFVELMCCSEPSHMLPGASDKALAIVEQLVNVVLRDDPVLVTLQAMALTGLDELEEHSSKFVERWLDPIMGIVILANAACLGIFAQADSEGWGTAQYVDTVFLLIFILEMVIKMVCNGVRGHFCRHDWQWNAFDAFIVTLGCFDLVLTIMNSTIDKDARDQGKFNPSSLMALRMIRVVRVVRLARVLKISLFRELKLMLNGIVGLLRTLLCAMGILLLTVYFLGICLSQLIGYDPAQEDLFVHGQEGLFGSVPKSMFTVFRCLMVGDCTTDRGTPISLQMSNTVGWPFVIVFCSCCVLMNYGLGSLITALVVDSTLNAAKSSEFKRSIRREEKNKAALTIVKLAAKLKVAQQDYDRQKTENGQQLAHSVLFMSRAVFQQSLHDPEVRAYLDEIDIDETDRLDLFDALDADGNGHLELAELIEGLVKMRGKARKADVVASRLIAGALMRKMTGLEEELLQNQKRMLEAMETVWEALHGPPSP